MSTRTLKDLFMDELADMYDAEHRILKTLPKLIETATCGELQDALQKHLEDTDGQIAVLERIFAAFDEKPRVKKGEAMAGILDEVEDIAFDNKKSPAINAALISAAQKVEHYEIASYGCLRAWAEKLENFEAAGLLKEILDEEKEADRVLTELSLVKNQEALVEVGARSHGEFE